MARITLIDDSAEFRDLMAEIMGGLGHNMIGMDAAQASVPAILATLPDLLMVDLHLGDAKPEPTGWALVRDARGTEALRSTPVIVCTADLWEIDSRPEEAAMVDVHIRTKPFSVQEISDLVDKVLSGAAGLQPAAALPS